MITARGLLADGGAVLLLGLSGENMARLMADEPIVVDGSAVGLPEITVAIIGGRTEDEITARLERCGLLTPFTECVDRRPPT